jgi:hypothetical protein
MTSGLCFPGGLFVCLHEGIASSGTKAAKLTPAEVAFIAALAGASGAPVSREEIQTLMGGPTSNRVDNVACRLRKKLRGLVDVDIFQSRYGKGWALILHPKLEELKAQVESGPESSGQPEDAQADRRSEAEIVNQLQADIKSQIEDWKAALVPDLRAAARAEADANARATLAEAEARGWAAARDQVLDLLELQSGCFAALANRMEGAAHARTVAAIGGLVSDLRAQVKTLAPPKTAR